MRSVILVWSGVEGLDGDGAAHSDAGMASFGVVPALMASVGMPVPADGFEPGGRDRRPRYWFRCRPSARLRFDNLYNLVTDSRFLLMACHHHINCSAWRFADNPLSICFQFAKEAMTRNSRSPCWVRL